MQLLVEYLVGHVKEKGVDQLCDGMIGLALREERCLVLRADIKQVISSRCRRYPRNPFRETQEYFGDVQDHVEHDGPGVGEVNIHS